MVLKIERTDGQQATLIRLSGQLLSNDLDELKSELERGGSRVALDLQEVDLVDRGAVRFLNECESAGVTIVHGSPYIREWMSQERSLLGEKLEP
jgi:hypothetical protein